MNNGLECALIRLVKCAESESDMMTAEALTDSGIQSPDFQTKIREAIGLREAAKYVRGWIDAQKPMG